MTEYYSIVCTYHILFIHSPCDGHMGCVHFVAIMSNAVKNICVQVFLWTCQVRSELIASDTRRQDFAPADLWMWIY